MISSAFLDVLVDRNFAERSVKAVTKDVCRRNVLSLLKEYGVRLFLDGYQQCFTHLIESSGLSTDTQKARIVNFLRVVRAMTAEEHAEAFAEGGAEERGEMISFLGGLLNSINGERDADALEKAQEDSIDEQYIPWTWIYNRTKEFCDNRSVNGDTAFILRCKLLGRLMVLDHPPRRNEMLSLEYPPLKKALTPAEKEDRNVWDGGRTIFLNKYKTHPVYGEYSMPISETARQLLEELRWNHTDLRQGAVFPNGTMPDYLSAILGTKVHVNMFRHSFYSYYYGHKHGEPIYMHEKNDIARMTGNSPKMHDHYIVRLKPYQKDRVAYYAAVMEGRNSNLNDVDRQLIKELDASVQNVAHAGPKVTKRKQSDLATSVLRDYAHLFVNKSTEEKRRERPYLYLSQCGDMYKDSGYTVAQILGGDPDLIKKWAAKIARESSP